MDDIEEVREATSPSEMRAEINRLRYYDPIARATMDAADYYGLSAEDRYTTLAYHALKSSADAHRKLFRYALSVPMPLMPINKEPK